MARVDLTCYWCLDTCRHIHISLILQHGTNFIIDVAEKSYLNPMYVCTIWTEVGEIGSHCIYTTLREHATARICYSHAGAI